MDFRGRLSPHSERISELVAFYKEFGLRDKAEREQSGTLCTIVRNPPRSLEIRLCPQGPGVREQGQESKRSSQPRTSSPSARFRSLPIRRFTVTRVLDPELDLRTVKHSIWKSVGDMRLFYREKEQRTDQTKIENETSKEGSVDS